MAHNRKAHNAQRTLYMCVCLFICTTLFVDKDECNMWSHYDLYVLGNTAYCVKISGEEFVAFFE